MGQKFQYRIKYEIEKVAPDSKNSVYVMKRSFEIFGNGSFSNWTMNCSLNIFKDHVNMSMKVFINE